jgi:hypothetical protein
MGKALLSVGWPFPPTAYEITPSGSRYYFEVDGNKSGWIIQAMWDTKNYWIA